MLKDFIKVIEVRFRFEYDFFGFKSYVFFIILCIVLYKFIWNVYNLKMLKLIIDWN